MAALLILRDLFQSWWRLVPIENWKKPCKGQWWWWWSLFAITALEVQVGNLEIFKCTCTHGHDVLHLCRQLAENAVTLYVVMRRSSRPGIPLYLPNSGRRIDLMAEFFTGISLMTGGQFIYSESVKLVSEVILMPKNASALNLKEPVTHICACAAFWFLVDGKFFKVGLRRRNLFPST